MSEGQKIKTMLPKIACLLTTALCQFFPCPSFYHDLIDPCRERLWRENFSWIHRHHDWTTSIPGSLRCIYLQAGRRQLHQWVIIRCPYYRVRRIQRRGSTGLAASTAPTTLDSCNRTKPGQLATSAFAVLPRYRNYLRRNWMSQRWAQWLSTWSKQQWN